MKKLIIAVIMMCSLAGFSQEKKYDKYEQLYTFQEIADYIAEVFPEAYITFLDISFYQQSGRILPGKALFYVPTKYLKKKKFSGKTMTKRVDKVLQLMGDPGSCHEYEIGESREFAWMEWEDKVVTGITIHFAIGC